ncbi:phosphatidate cytidylyltransferase [Angomonas deanei]|uniref:Phosphatidate cytidylyltransferase n=1 Tax=Angomonas deanei TaxID=59799 RepID=A0A7G2C5P2_9TRYP|nr:phosphatidate cytidylyltransferase [Angomonas deanei]CAD2215118.1 Cytidylyltransferase family, putative [Angomonas deanei]|eukprot:EPY29196.1 phosphatidate cytidylyltransferase [Angomonas deanei]
MAYVFLSLIPIGVLFGVALSFIICITMLYEVTRINQRVRRERQLPSLHIIKWYLITIFFVFSTLYTMRVPLENTFPSLVGSHKMISFAAFCATMVGLVGFVLSLRKGMYRYQFIQFTWIVMSLLVLGLQYVASQKCMIQGMIWFLLPVSCVVNNDIWAYIFGKLFGRTRLLALSPKKTVEGFLGAFLYTVIWSFWFCGFLGYFPEMYCPCVGFTNAVNAVCEKDPLFVQAEVPFPPMIQQLSGGYLSTFRVSPAQKHAIVLGIFSSLIAPFGGFFASGLKRAFNLKDFGDLIPGHGGMTDRMDCQGLMAIFTFFYIHTYVYDKCPSSSDIFTCALSLPVGQRRALIEKLTSSLVG